MFYHLCLRCDAKFFTPEAERNCPRCGNWSVSTEWRLPPWANVQTGADFEKRFAEQQRRLNCQGGG